MLVTISLRALSLRAIMLGPLLAASGCGSPDDPPPTDPVCPVDGTPSVELAHADFEFGQWVDGGDVIFQNAPQGGPPFSAFRFRLRSMHADGELIHVSMLATDDGDGSTLAATEYDHRFVCANRGDSAGAFVTAELHLRYASTVPEEIEGRAATFSFTLTDVRDRTVTADLQGRLVYLTY